ncbi:MAG: K+/H+ antiporter subunit F [Rhodobacterales bacterium]|nr:K+/H+ antiporter subunit F [Rhodobacterales bacterium]
MIQIAAAFAMGCFGLGLLANLWLALRSSSMIDRILAVDTMTINVIALIVLYGIHTGSGLNFEAALLFAMTGFLGTVVYCKYLLRGDIIE